MSFYICILIDSKYGWMDKWTKPLPVVISRKKTFIFQFGYCLIKKIIIIRKHLLYNFKKQFSLKNIYIEKGHKSEIHKLTQFFTKHVKNFQH